MRDELRELLFALRVMRKNEEEKAKNSKPRPFQDGDRVFDIRYGWGTVEIIRNRKFNVKVYFDNSAVEYYLEDGRYFF